MKIWIESILIPAEDSVAASFYISQNNEALTRRHHSNGWLMQTDPRTNKVGRLWIGLESDAFETVEQLKFSEQVAIADLKKFIAAFKEEHKGA